MRPNEDVVYRQVPVKLTLADGEVCEMINEFVCVTLDLQTT